MTINELVLHLFLRKHYSEITRDNIQDLWNKSAITANHKIPKRLFKEDVLLTYVLNYHKLNSLSFLSNITEKSDDTLRVRAFVVRMVRLKGMDTAKAF